MVVKRYMKCNKCESYVNFYISEEKSIENVNVSCQCGKKYIYMRSRKEISFRMERSQLRRKHKCIK